MCFFKTPKLPEVKVPDRPTVTETKAPEVEAPVFGTSENTPQSETKGDKGVSSLKVPKMPPVPKIELPKTASSKTGYKL